MTTQPEPTATDLQTARTTTAPAGRRTIATLPSRLRELGRIRLGIQVPTERGGTRPTALDTFRLTSPSRPLIEAAAEAFGGAPEPWQPPEGPPQWQVVTDTDVLEVLVPPTHALDQTFELWRAGGCHRRCDGIVDELSGAPCQCPTDPEERTTLAADGQACNPVTRVNVMLPELPDLGVWRVEAHGYYAAVELGGAGWLLDQAAQAGRLLTARLRLDQRHVKRPGQPRRDFVVPVLELPYTLGQALAAAGATDQIAGPLPAAALAGPPPPALDQSPADRGGAPGGAIPPESPGDDRDTLVEQILATIDDAAIPRPHLEALLAARYHVAAVEQLHDDQLAALARRLSAEGGVETLRAAASSDFAAAQQPRCRSCGHPSADLDDNDECRTCAVPF